MDNLSDELAAWDAAASRGKERSLLRQAAESTTLAGLFVELAERGDAAAVRLVGGAGTRTGVVRSVGADFAVIGSAYVPFAGVAWVRAESASSSRPVVGDRVGSTLAFAATVARLAEERPQVSAVLDGGDVVNGVLAVAGDGVVLVGATWVALDAVRALLVV